eukprot:CAMPEP_0113535096 /NCGR_PEP_ID=MMETSP0015_2-20120614/5514_1 /TAXON_ID=2838 /ORGANISM="Odontella" /LENGTH=386 /DNA_ID=CAMNT_0000434309 /DNA_START=137 /DNA_END=1297 /DNA_ORIENTATION=- /assembly_acc=CAM_ASM_000160
MSDNKPSSVSESWSPRPLPDAKLVIGYSHDPAAEKVRRSIKSGVNVVCWSFLHFIRDPGSSQPMVRTDLDLSEIHKLRYQSGLEKIVHVAAVGGWNAPHPPSGIKAESWANAFWELNVQNGYIFDGIDWDLEGHDDRLGPTSKFTLETLDIMADVSVLLKEKYGMLVSMAPAESYFDALAEDSSFSTDLNLFPRPWDRAEADRDIVIEAGFQHAGQQCYAYVFHRAGGERTFDWVGLQLYEAYSRFMHETSRLIDPDIDESASQVEGVLRRTVALFDGFSVNLPKYGETRISISPNRLVFGFANGWADNKKFVRVRPEALRDVLMRLKIAGFMFWTIEEEGRDGVYMADLISNAIMQSEEQDEHENDEEDSKFVKDEYQDETREEL